MSDIQFMIECVAELEGTISQIVEEGTGHTPSASRRNNLDGSPETVLLIVQTAASAIAALAPLIIPYLQNRNVKKIRFGDIEIENPTEDQWKTIWQEYRDSTDDR